MIQILVTHFGSDIRQSSEMLLHTSYLYNWKLTA